MVKYNCPSNTCLISAANYLINHLDSHQNGEPFNYDGTQQPLLVEAGSTTIGDEPYCANVRVFVLQRLSLDYFHVLNSDIKSSDKYIQDAVKAAEDFKDVDESLVVVTRDGVPMLFVLKDGMLAGLAPLEQERKIRQSRVALKELAKNYHPPKKANNSRDSGLRQSADSQDKGVFHFCYWKEAGHGNDPFRLSKEAEGKSDQQKATVATYMRRSAWEHVMISRWLKALDLKCWTSLNNCYRNNRAELEHLDQGPEGIQSCFVINFNHAVNPHKDKADAKEGWVATNPWGSFTGGQLVLPELRLKVTQPEGTLVLCRATVLEHWITPIDGERSSHTRFTREKVLNPVDPGDKTPCPFPGCKSTNKKLAAFLEHFRNYHKTGTLTDLELSRIEQSIESSDSFSKDTKEVLKKKLQSSRTPRQTKARKDAEASAKEEAEQGAAGNSDDGVVFLGSNKRKRTVVAPGPAKRQRNS